MKIHFDEVTGRVTGYTTFGDAPLGSLDLGEGIDYNFTADLDEYEVQNGTVVHVGPSAEKLLVLKEAERNVQKAIRDTALKSMTHTLADGAVVQVRVEDLSNFQTAISIGVDQDWVLADNTVRLLTVVEMQECVASGVAQAKAIWATYTTYLKNNP